MCHRPLNPRRRARVEREHRMFVARLLLTLVFLTFLFLGIYGCWRHPILPRQRTPIHS